jgi:hypothetical protein
MPRGRFDPTLLAAPSRIVPPSNRAGTRTLEQGPGAEACALLVRFTGLRVYYSGGILYSRLEMVAGFDGGRGG